MTGSKRRPSSRPSTGWWCWPWPSHGLVRLPERVAGPRQPAHALADSAGQSIRRVPLCGALVALFGMEQMVNGWKNGFEGPEDDEPAGACGMSYGLILFVMAACSCCWATWACRWRSRSSRACW